MFLLGWCLALLVSVGDCYLETRTIRAACLDIAWVLGSVFWGLRQLPWLIDGLENCFVAVNYAEAAEKWKGRFFSNAWMLACFAVVFAVGATALYLGMFHGNPHSTHHVFPACWYQGDRSAKFWLLLTVGFFASLAAGAGISLFAVNLPFAFSLLKLPVVPLPNVLLAKPRPMSDFYVAGTLAWFVAVGLTAYIFFQNMSDTAIGFLLVTSVIGLTAFIVPQVIFHILVVRALSQMADEAYQELRRWSEDQDVTNLSFLLKGVNDSVKANSMWVFDRSDVASLLVPELITIVGLILKSGIVGRHF